MRCAVLLRSRPCKFWPTPFDIRVFSVPLLASCSILEPLNLLKISLAGVPIGQDLQSGAFPADWAGYVPIYAMPTPPQLLILHVRLASTAAADSGLPLMLLPSCWTYVLPPDLLLAAIAHLLRADLHISNKVPKGQQATRLFSAMESQGHTQRPEQNGHPVACKLRLFTLACQLCSCGQFGGLFWV
jgi:hypothetical protein